MSLKSVIKYFENEIFEINSFISECEKKISDNNILIKEANLIIDELNKELKKSDRISPVYKKKTDDKIVNEKVKLDSYISNNTKYTNELSLLKKKKKSLEDELKIVESANADKSNFVSKDKYNELKDSISLFHDDMNNYFDNYEKIIQGCSYSDPSRTIIEFNNIKNKIDKSFNKIKLD